VSRLVVRLVAAVLMTAAAGLVVSAPAQGASCPGAHGVTVVVDFHELGGGAQSACDANGSGKTALTQLTDVGRTLTYVQRQPGFVCRVDGAPASDPCVNTPPSDAYWSLWWSDGKSGRWTYASTGVGSLEVPDGGYVALSWQGGDSKAPPGVTPAAHASAPPPPTPSSPTPSPTRHPSSPPTATPATQAPASAPTATTSGGPAPTHSSAKSHPARHHRPSKTPAATPTADATDLPATTTAAEPLDRTAAGSDSGLPGWVAPVLVGALFVAAGVVAFVRRKRTGGA
jgi:hypothetical protein